MASKAHIEVYARVRPVKRPSPHFDVDFANHAIGIHTPKDNTHGIINNQRENYSFAFSRILDGGTTQDQVFETVAQPVVDSVLEGYNGTIFAYGQTGSGKTFTITGGAERYVVSANVTARKPATTAAAAAGSWNPRQEVGRVASMAAADAKTGG